MNIIMARTAADGAAGAAKLMIFLFALILMFWGLNTYKHYKNGWSKLQKICDISGIVLFAAAIAAMIFPLLR